MGRICAHLSPKPPMRPVIKEADVVRQIEESTRTGAQANAGQRLTLGIGDNAALWKPRSGFETILTTDWFLEGTHFWRDWHPPEAVGWKCVMRAASDIAAMGGAPSCLLLSLALPPAFAGGWLGKFLMGLNWASAKLKCPLVGGDTTRSDQILIHLTVVGEVSRGKALLRSGAKPGDLIYVTGRLGEAELGLRLAREYRRRGRRAEGKLLLKHLYPEARIALAGWLGKTRLASGAMDLSDGLSLDLQRLCVASGVGAILQTDCIPLAGREFTARFPSSERIKAALNGGDDYELLFCVNPESHHRIPANKFGVKLTQIGEITKKHGITIVGAAGQAKELLPQGWEPF